MDQEQIEPSGKEFDIESKEVILSLFKKFDKDNSGSIDFNEIVLLASELKIALNKEEIQNIFKDLDTNKDNKISFDELWEWWKRGRPNKLEKLIYFKLKSLKLLKKAHSEFMRLGGSLESKYENIPSDKVDTYYAAVNYGTHPGDLRIEARIFLNNKECQSMFQQFNTNLQSEALGEYQIGIMIRFKSTNAKDDAAQLKLLIDQLLSATILSAEGQEMLMEIITAIFVEVTNEKDKVVVKIKLPPSLKTELFGGEEFVTQVVNNYSYLIEQIKLCAEVSLGIKNSIRNALNNSDNKFINWLFEGFLGELKISCNRDFTNQFGHGILQFLALAQNIAEGSFQCQMLTKAKYQEMKEKNQLGIIFAQLRGCKVRLTFKDVQDVNNLIAGLGLQEEAQQQASIKELIEELKSESTFLKDMKDPDSIWNIIYKFINLLSKICNVEGSMSVLFHKMALKVNLKGEGLGSLINQLFE